MRIAAIALSLCAFDATADAQQGELRRILDSVRTTSHLPALAGAIVSTDSLLALDVVGVRKLGDTTRAARDDLFHLGSDTKAMTAGLLGLLVDQGRLRWSATIGELFPELVSSMRDEYRTLTLNEVLSHQSGFVPNPTIQFREGTPRAQRVAFARWVLQQPPATARGTYAYANANYILAGAIAERLYDGEYEQIVNDRLLRPLGMTTVGFGAPGSAEKVDQPWPHREAAAGGVSPLPPGPSSDNPPVFGPAGRAHMSMADWSLWARAILRAARGGRSPWTAATASAMFSPVAHLDSTVGYGYGWLVVRGPRAQTTGRALTHAGSNTLNYADIWLAPEEGFGVLVATNQGGTAAARAVEATVSRLIALHRATTKP